jgi:hypothetical protein
VTLTGGTADLNAALATLVYRGVLNYSGADALSPTLGNGGFNWNVGVAITVISAAQQAADLEVLVNALVAAGRQPGTGPGPEPPPARSCSASPTRRYSMPGS